MRYRLIPTRPLIHCTLHIEHDGDEAALAHAAKLAAERKDPDGRVGDRVLVCAAPVGGIVREVGTVGPIHAKGRKVR